MNKTALAISMLIYLKGNGLCKKQEIADYLETNVRNIKELRNELEVAGYHIEITNGPHGGYRLIDTSFFPLSNLDATQREALISASSYLLSSNQPTLNKDFKAGYLKLLANEKVYTTIQSDTNHLVMSSQLIEDYLQQLKQAIKESRRVKISYQRDLVLVKEYLFEPYDCILVNDLWYVVGFIKNDHWASLKLNRINEIQFSEETFLVDNSFSVSSMLNEFGFKFNDVVSLVCEIKNHPYIIERVYGKNQTIEILDSKTFKLSVDIDSKFRAQQFILQFGSDIKILQPQWLRDFQKDEAQKILNR